MNANKMLGAQDSAEEVLLVAMEMSRKAWRLAIAPPGSHKRSVTTIEGGNYAALLEAVSKACKRFALSPVAKVIFCYEAGGDGFYPYRRLVELGHTVWVVDSSSIEVNRRQRQAKSDGIDADKLLVLMQRQAMGEERALKVVRVPTRAEEDERQLSREREELNRECSRLRTRMRALVFAQGEREFPTSAARIGRWLIANMSRLGTYLYERLGREQARLDCVEAQLRLVEKQIQGERECATPAGSGIAQVAQRLARLRGIADTGANTLSAELFGWRRFRNRREVGACVGLCPTPYNSGDSVRERGISKAGSGRVRRVIVELSWYWLRYQPDSALSRWYAERFADHGKRARRIGIVALGRRLLIALWRYLEHGVVPEGALFKAV